MSDFQATSGFFPGTGTQTVALSSVVAKSFEMYYGSSTYKPSRGFVIVGGSQHTIPDEYGNAVSGKGLQIKNSSGTVVFEANFVSQTGSNYAFNVTINTIPGAITVFFKGRDV